MGGGGSVRGVRVCVYVAWGVGEESERERERKGHQVNERVSWGQGIYDERNKGESPGGG